MPNPREEDRMGHRRVVPLPRVMVLLHTERRVCAARRGVASPPARDWPLMAWRPIDFDGHALSRLVDDDENGGLHRHGEQRCQDRSYEPNRNGHGHNTTVSRNLPTSLRSLGNHGKTTRLALRARAGSAAGPAAARLQATPWRLSLSRNRVTSSVRKLFSRYQFDIGAPDKTKLRTRMLLRFQHDSVHN